MLQLSLDMALESVDDQYNGCRETMLPLVYKSLEQKKNSDMEFKKAWTTAEIQGIHGNELGLNYSIALYLYTHSGNHGPPIYKMFNDATRTGKNDYKSKTYKWYFLYYWLTMAIQDLKKHQTSCLKTYRGTKLDFSKTIEGTYIRLGSFASSSPDPDQAVKFGRRSCFEIYTCYGADISQYSATPEEKEVLLPPYEIFNVTQVSKNDSWCENVYTLKSFNARSNLNCSVAAGRSLTEHSYQSLWVACGSIITFIHRFY